MEGTPPRCRQPSPVGVSFFLSFYFFNFNFNFFIITMMAIIIWLLWVILAKEGDRRCWAEEIRE